MHRIISAHTITVSEDSQAGSPPRTSIASQQASRAAPAPPIPSSPALMEGAAAEGVGVKDSTLLHGGEATSKGEKPKGGEGDRAG